MLARPNSASGSRAPRAIACRTAACASARCARVRQRLPARQRLRGCAVAAPAARAWRSRARPRRARARPPAASSSPPPRGITPIGYPARRRPRAGRRGNAGSRRPDARARDVQRRSHPQHARRRSATSSENRPNGPSTTRRARRRAHREPPAGRQAIGQLLVVLPRIAEHQLLAARRQARVGPDEVGVSPGDRQLQPAPPDARASRGTVTPARTSRARCDPRCPASPTESSRAPGKRPLQTRP